MNAFATPARFDRGSQHRRSMIAKVHIAKTQLGLVDDDYQAVLLRVVGHDSAAKCSDADLIALVKEFERLGFTAKSKSVSVGARKPADHPSARKARALWISLHQLGVVRNASEEALEAFAARQLGVARLQWANQGQAYKLIEALKVMAERAGWSQDTAGVRPAAVVTVLKRRLIDALFAKLKSTELVPAHWDIATAAFRLGGIIVETGYHHWSLIDLDRIAKLFGAKLREHAA